MKLQFSLVLALFLSLVFAVDGRTSGLNLTARGAEIDAESMGQFTLELPILQYKGGKTEKPVGTFAEGALKAVYASGMTVEYGVDPATQKIRVKFSKVPEGGHSLKFLMYLPTRFNQGGSFAFDGDLKPIPAEKGPQFLQHGNAKRFTIQDATGDNFTLETRGGYTALQDNRVFNWPVYVYSYQYDFWGKTTEGQCEFTVTFGRAAETAGVPAQKKFVVDRYGQSVRKEYPGKVSSDDDLRGDVAKEAAWLKPLPGLKTDVYGGLEGSGEKYGLKKTGFFHVEKLNGRPVLVSPEGNLFFQLGVCGIANCDDYTTVKGREKIFEWIPDAKGEFAGAWRPKDAGVVSFQIANWIRKYQKPYSSDEWISQAATRLRAWGFNSAGAFSSYPEALRKIQFPTVGFLPGGGEFGAKALPDKIGVGKLMDPFAPGTAEALDKAFAKSIAPKATDPLIIGFFLGNEQHFEILPKLIPSYKSTVPAKMELVKKLKEKYGEIGKFNSAWQQTKTFSSFDELADEPLFVKTDAAAADMREYFVHFLDAYYSAINTAFRKHDPNHLLIGSRWTPGTASNEDVVRVGGKYLDVISVNYYTYGIEKDFLQKVYEWGGRPILLSEWYYACTDHGLGAHKEVKDQKERGEAYRNYVEQTAALPFVVGSQWFIYTDQALTGRFFEGFNGEGNNTGLVDVADRPYMELIEACKQTHRRIYDVVLGLEKPYAYADPRFDGSKSGGRKTLAVPKALPGMKMDGTTSNWPGRPAEPVEPGRLVLGNPNPKLRGDFRMCWDETNLYFYIQVKDPTPLQNTYSGGSLWNADAVELFIGGKNLGQAGTMQYSDRQILLGAGTPAKVHITGQGNESLAKDCKVLAVKDVGGDGYVLQAALPWSALGIKPEPGAELLFDLAIDNSDTGQNRIQQLMWNGTAGSSGDRGKWGRMRLVEN